MCVGVSMWLGWSGIRVTGWSTVCASACNTDTTPTQPHWNSNTHRTKNNTTKVVIQQNSRKLLMMDILMSETCWAHKKWNKIASDIKLVFYSSTITMMHGPINIKFNMLQGCSNGVLYCIILSFPQGRVQDIMGTSGILRVAWRRLWNGYIPKKSAT